MKKLNIYLLLLITVGFVTFNGCKKKKPVAQFLKDNCFKAKQVRENGVIVYTLGGASNTKPAYSKFKVVLNLPPNGVEITENDGTVTKGTWVFTDPNIAVSGLNPPLTDAATGTNTRTTADYKVSGYNAKTKEVTFTALTKNLKVGDVTVDYTMVPCQ
jgi:hypothetical protein